jgi:hypothetical protein
LFEFILKENLLPTVIKPACLIHIALDVKSSEDKGLNISD